jgi:mRNA interferase MazF
MKRGDLVTVSLPGDYGKPRPALIVQSDLFADLPSVTLLPVTGELHDAPLFRLEIAPSSGNGLQRVSQIMVDKAHTLARERVGPIFGSVDDATMLAVNRSLALFFGFA